LPPCTEVLHGAKYGRLVIFLGVGGVGLYLARCREKEAKTKDYEYWRQKFKVLKLIFADVIHCNRAWSKSEFINGKASLSKVSLKKTLKASENITHRKNTKDFSSEIMKNRNKRIPFNTRMKTAKDKLIIQR
jgi:hypothetical protein